MAEAFEDRLYVLIAEFEGKNPELVAHFKAKGDDALVYADLSNYQYYDEEEVLDEVIALMLEFGLPIPPGEKMTAQSRLFSKGVWDIQDITVGDLKQAVKLAKWPDAWIYRENSWWDLFRDLLTIPLTPVIVVAIIAFLPFLICWQAVQWVAKRLSHKPA
jgi:hypothetical protein